MTREAIEYFKFYRKIFCEDHLKICPKDSIAYQATLKEKEFYDMAIEALEQELSGSEIPNKSETKIDCDNIYCNNCVNHKYCDYETTSSGKPNKSEIPTGSIAQERYQDLIDYFGNEKVAKTILEDRKEFKAWLERLKWHVKRVDELARELEQLKSTTKNDLEVQKAIEIIKADSLASYSVNEIISARDLAVEALKQMQTTKNDLGVDCISRQQAINAFPNLLPNVGYNKKTITEILQDLPSVTPQEPRWIPVSERLPTKEEYIANNGLFIVSDGNRTYAEYFDVYNSKKFFGEPTMNGFRVDRCVIAWMPLPKPYREVEE